jgi:two-component system response regulator YesN
MSNVAYVKRIVRVHFSEIHSIKDVARFTNHSVETIRRDFARSEHISLSEYIRGIRVEMAKHLLITTEKSCQEICESVGFCRADVGARVFRKFTGRTMREYRYLSSHKEVRTNKTF